jgi:hypothetical protein
VEALLDGDTAAVEELLRLCRRGPLLAEVTAIHEEFSDEQVPAPEFQRLPTA